MSDNVAFGLQDENFPNINSSLPFLGFNSSIAEHAEKFLLEKMGPKRKDLGSVVTLTAFYGFIFLSGVIGNVCTCIVITKNSYMRTATNIYLVNLALADILTLIFTLPPELYTVWEAYPWRFGETFCLFKTFLFEMTYYTSILTITAFTVERYIAIWHPLKAEKISKLSRVLIVILFTWLIASVCALPFPIYTRVFYYTRYPDTGEYALDSLVCNIPLRWQDGMGYVFGVSTFVFFITPMIVITVMHILIGLKIRTSDTPCDSRTLPQAKSVASKARRAVFKMLVAVVIAFFVCWAPFHSQRLMTLSIKVWSEKLLKVQSHIFYVSGVLYFFSSTVNPILYNLLSRKFRQAFKRTICRRCCIDIGGLPGFYSLKGKFMTRRLDKSQPFTVRCRTDKPILLATFNNNSEAKNKNRIYSTKKFRHVPSTSNDAYLLRYSMVQNENPSLSISAHVHSDGRLQNRCRHRYCRHRRNFLSENCDHNLPNTSYSFNEICIELPRHVTNEKRPSLSNTSCDLAYKSRSPSQQSFRLLTNCHN